MWLESYCVTQAQAAESNFSLENHPPSWTLRVRCGSVVVPCPTSPILRLFHTVSCNFHAVSNLASHCFRHLMLRIVMNCVSLARPCWAPQATLPCATSFGLQMASCFWPPASAAAASGGGILRGGVVFECFWLTEVGKCWKLFDHGQCLKDLFCL